MEETTLTIPGVLVTDGERLNKLRQRFGNICRVKKNAFIGAQPVSFSLKDLDTLEKEDFFISEKADGIRCLMLLIKDDGPPETYLIDRKNDYYYLEMGLPARVWGQWRTDTILDGELVLESVDHISGKRTVYLIFDCISMDQLLLSGKGYDVRLGFITEHIIKPLQMHAQKLNDLQLLKFDIRLKSLETSYNIVKLLETMKALKHNSDGIVFTSRTSPYIFGTCNTMLKWKAHEDNTVDFELKNEGEGYAIYIRTQQGSKYIGRLKLDREVEESWNMIPPMNGTIVECKYIKDTGEWKFVRIRTDKPECNYISTYLNIIDSIDNHVPKEAISERSPSIRQKWRERMCALNPDSRLKKTKQLLLSDDTLKYCEAALSDYEKITEDISLIGSISLISHTVLDLTNDLY